jgi:hypothetical protein
VSDPADHDCFPPDAPPDIPPDAVEVPTRAVWAEPGCQGFDCVLGDQVVGYRVRTGDGLLVREGALKDGVPHGVERTYDSDGALDFQTGRCHGVEHGVARQWDKGQLLGTYTLNHGTGLDQYLGGAHSLLEERYLLDGNRHGFERWWNEDNHTVWMESHFQRGQNHGIFRRWNHTGRLMRGYPQYFVEGRHVTKRQYLKSADDDPTLPPFRGEENRPERELPAEYVQAQSRA